MGHWLYPSATQETHNRRLNMADETERTDEIEQRLYPWREGTPTAPDVALLQKTYPNLKAGDRIPYEDVEKLIDVPHGSSRWKSVTDAWRRHELEQGRVIDCETNAAFIVLVFDQCAAKSYQVHQRTGRMHRKQRRSLATYRPFEDEQRRLQMHLMAQHAARERDARKDRSNILPPTDVQPMPRITPPEA
jgi:hypothetical protein